ncbi:exported hypothetical protein [Azospirillaceae bacterium]
MRAGIFLRIGVLLAIASASPAMVRADGLPVAPSWIIDPEKSSSNRKSRTLPEPRWKKNFLIAQAESESRSSLPPSPKWIRTPGRGPDGQLIGIPIPPEEKPASPHHLGTPPVELVHLVETIAANYSVDPQLALAVMAVESSYRSNVVSPKNAAGLMQLIPDTAARFGVNNVFDPSENIRGGIKYLRWLLAYFEGNVTLAVAGYNAGEKAVDRYCGVPPYAETEAYVRLIQQAYAPRFHRFDAAATKPSSGCAQWNLASANK